MPGLGLHVDPSLATALGVGFLLGLTHAMDADHIAALAVLVSGRRGGTRLWLPGAIWGAGHAVALIAVGAVVIAFRLTIPGAVERALEALVNVLLLLFGGRLLFGTLGRLRVHRHLHSHGTLEHRHVHRHSGPVDAHEHAHLLRAGGRPFLVGLVQGLAGSAALALVVLASIPHPLGQLAYIVLFGAGSMAAMLVLSRVMAASLLLAMGRGRTTGAIIQAGAGAGSVLLGLLRLASLA